MRQDAGGLFVELIWVDEMASCETDVSVITRVRLPCYAKSLPPISTLLLFKYF